MNFELTPQYRDYINSARWKAKTRLFWKVKGAFCEACGSTKNLNCHHMDYSHFGNEPLADLAGVCGECHRAIHAEHRATGRQTSLRVVTLRYIRQRRLQNTRPKRR